MQVKLTVKFRGWKKFPKLNQQTADRWYKTEIKDRNISIDWYYTAGHPARWHKYYITKQGWDQNKPVTRDAFDAEPFCYFDLPFDTKDGYLPAGTTGNGRGLVPHECTVPADRTGSHIIMGVWDVGDTPNNFNEFVDVNILAEAPGPDGWAKSGSINSTVDLLVGDKVKVRAFGNKGEAPEYSTEIVISDTQQGKRDLWSFLLAEKINATQELVIAGVRDAKGEIKPVQGANNVFAKAESGVTRFEVDNTQLPDPSAVRP